MTKYFFDWEFDDEQGQLEPISLGVVCEDGREYYAVSSDYNEDHASPWLKQHVIPYLGDERKPLSVIRQELLSFISARPNPEWFAYFSAWDFMLLVRLMGGWNNFPSSWRLYCTDLRAMMDWANVKSLPPQTGQKHNALEDARWNKTLYEWIKSSS
jgi:hypothetical protein